jgi:hypothetical protein
MLARLAVEDKAETSVPSLAPPCSGEQTVYASGKAIMFSLKACYFFVRPRKSDLECVVFLSDGQTRPGFRSVQQVSRSKFVHTCRVVYADQVEGALTDAIQHAFQRESTRS